MFLHQDIEDKRTYEALPDGSGQQSTKEVIDAKKAYESAFSYFVGCKGSERGAAQERLNVAAEKYHRLYYASLP